MSDKPKDYDEFISQIGKTLIQWNAVEQQLFEIFVHALYSPTKEVSYAVYSSVINFNIKRDMVDAAVLACLKPDDDESKDIIKKWKTVYRGLKKLGPIRNHVAHYFCYNLEVDTKELEKKYNIKVEGEVEHLTVLAKPQYTTKPRSEEDPVYSDIIYLPTLKKYEKDFRNLANELLAFNQIFWRERHIEVNL